MVKRVSLLAVLVLAVMVVCMSFASAAPAKSSLARAYAFLGYEDYLVYYTTTSTSATFYLDYLKNQSDATGLYMRGKIYTSGGTLIRDTGSYYVAPWSQWSGSFTRTTTATSGTVRLYLAGVYQASGNWSRP